MFENTGGCPHMNCDVCKHEWCYICGFPMKHCIHKIQLFGGVNCQMGNMILKHYETLAENSYCCLPIRFLWTLVMAAIGPPLFYLMFVFFGPVYLIKSFGPSCGSLCFCWPFFIIGYFLAAAFCAITGAFILVQVPFIYVFLVLRFTFIFLKTIFCCRSF